VPDPLVIFDCDGVLVDSERISNRVLADLITEAGRPTTMRESMATYMGRTMPRCIEMIEELIGRPVREDFYPEYRRRVFESLHQELEPIPGIAAALESIPHPRCVASSSGLDRIELSLRLTRLLNHFEGRLFSGTEVANGKPAPDVFLYAARRMGREPSHCVVVEDSPIGVQAGVAAGMTVLGFARDSDADALRERGAIPFQAMTELPELLERVFP
jgi:HAD superfamily hydrolase (TIGR01509 family)